MAAHRVNAPLRVGPPLDLTPGLPGFNPGSNNRDPDDFLFPGFPHHFQSSDPAGDISQMDPGVEHTV